MKYLTQAQGLSYYSVLWPLHCTTSVSCCLWWSNRTGPPQWFLWVSYHAMGAPQQGGPQLRNNISSVRRAWEGTASCRDSFSDLEKRPVRQTFVFWLPPCPRFAGWGWAYFLLLVVKQLPSGHNPRCWEFWTPWGHWVNRTRLWMCFSNSDFTVLMAQWAVSAGDKDIWGRCLSLWASVLFPETSQFVSSREACQDGTKAGIELVTVRCPFGRDWHSILVPRP